MGIGFSANAEISMVLRYPILLTLKDTHQIADPPHQVGLKDRNGISVIRLADEK